MCGLTGFLGGNSKNIDNISLLKRMTDTLVSRGPDDGGYWTDDNARIAIGHRRLAVADLSETGQQPMFSASQRYCIAFNGEIYNHLALRRELGRLNGNVWKGKSDTETLLAAFDAWGIEIAVTHIVGMFSIAVWDRENKTLTLIRDRLGEKPLYYGWQNEQRVPTFLFGSELKALRAHPIFNNRVNRDAICLQMQSNCIPAPYSIYEGIYKLMPGTLLTVSLKNPEPKIKSYWKGVEAATRGYANPWSGTEEGAISALENLLKEAVCQQMEAEVPLGAFLSGGIDSSLIVALMQSQSSKPIRTFTIGFEQEQYNETEYARAVAKHLGTDHIELCLTAERVLDVIPLLPTLYDEPFSDSSQIPTYLVSKLARGSVTVALTGDAGDELFCGYNRYLFASKLWNGMDATPAIIRRSFAKALSAVPSTYWNRGSSLLNNVAPRFARGSKLMDKVIKGIDVLDSESLDALYLRLASHWRDPESVVIGGRKPIESFRAYGDSLSGIDDIHRMMAFDMLTYLPDDLLVKTDRAAMGVSLETRMPFLDHRVVEFAWQLPQSLKLRNGKTKWILRQILDRYVPKHLVERPKMGFGVPLGDWLRGSLFEWAESLLDKDRLTREGFFQPGPIRKKWEEHVSGNRDWQHHLWDVLMFQSWLENQK